MKYLFLAFFLFPLCGLSHPGVGIVKDSKGNIYYTDLKQVWKIAGGKKSVIVPNVHTHELYIDQHDNLYGEGGYYDPKTKKFYHYVWVRYSNGKIDTVIGMKEAYVQQDFSLARDRSGNEFYIKQYLAHPDHNHIYRKTPAGKETILATGNFKGVTWLHVQPDGTLLYALNNAIYRVDTVGNIRMLRNNIGNKKPSFKFSGNSITIWGVWEDRQRNVYVAVFSDQVVRKIDVKRNITEVYRSTGNWAPLHGVFDNEGRLWVLESSDKNEIRVTRTGINRRYASVKNSQIQNFILIGFLTRCILSLFIRKKSRQNKYS